MEILKLAQQLLEALRRSGLGTDQQRAALDVARAVIGDGPQKLG
jgi:hypothetical protein